MRAKAEQTSSDDAPLPALAVTPGCMFNMALAHYLKTALSYLK
jgi:hypothetical protein